jgi:hypothetical protein
MKTSILTAAAAVSLGVFGAVTAQAQDHPMASDHAAQNPATHAPDKMTHAPLARGKNSFTQKQARSRLEKAGYSHVTNLAQDQDGLWQARAMHHGKWVNAAVDFKGNVAAR